MNSPIEPWLRGPLDVPAHLMPIFFSFTQVREDLALHTAALTPPQLWHCVTGKHSLGFHLKHIAGSADRLTTYLIGGELTPTQLDFLRSEHTPDASLPALLSLINENLHVAEQQLLQVKNSELFDPRFVGRNRLPSSVMGLIVHVCEHTQRHLGQAILIAKLLNV